VHELTRFQLI